MDHNDYLPKVVKFVSIKEEVSGGRAIKTFRAQFVDNDGFKHQCGQCAMLSVLGKGESMISISSSPLETDFLQFSILKTGRVTSALHSMHEGDMIGIRGPYGNNFPVEEWKGKNLIFAGGGIGLAPIWSVLQTAIRNKSDYGDMTLFYGSRSSNDIIYKEDLEALKTEMTVHLSIDVEEEEWKEYVGFVPSNILDKKPSPKNAIAITCGPPIMIKFAIQNLKELGFEDEQIYTTVENKMKCGIGKCGRCNIGLHYVCKDGPVYSWAELKQLPQEY
ncbi:FAD/NAD(P)-binding protein [Acidobacteriota bacterium]